MIIDSHLHVAISENKPWEPVITQLLHDMKQAGIEKSCLMPRCQYPGHIYPNQADMIYQARTLQEIEQSYPGNFFPMLFVNPLLPIEFLKNLISQYVLQGSIIGIKFHISMLADDIRLEPLYDFLETHNIPILFHSWYKTVSKGTFESNPGHIAAAAKKHPRLRILMAHLTACKIRGIQEIKSLPNVYVDTSGSFPEEGYLHRAIEELGADRILYGSDYPIRALSVQIARIDSVEMSKQDKQKLLYENALKFYCRGRSE